MLVSYLVSGLYKVRNELYKLINAILHLYSQEIYFCECYCKAYKYNTF